MVTRGFFLSLDGIDGCGKSTQCRLLVDWLQRQGRIVTPCHDPGGTVVGDQLRQLLLHHKGDMALACEALLFMASRAQLVAEVIRPALNAGHMVVADRYVLANVVYQGHAAGLDPALLWDIGRLATGDALPDLTLVLDVPVATARARRTGKPDRLESRAADYQKRVRAGFLAEALRQPERIVVVDAALDTELVQQRIREEVTRGLAAHSRA